MGSFYNKQEVISFKKVIPAGTVAEYSERVKGEGTVEKISATFYEGQNGLLHVRPYIQHKGEKIEDLITYPTGCEKYIAGNAESNKVYDVCVSVENDDDIYVFVDNTSAEDLTLTVEIVVDYYEGKNRVIGGVI